MLPRHPVLESSLRSGNGFPSVPREPVKLDAEPIVYTAGKLVASCPEVCNHEVPPVMLPVLQATRWRIVLTWGMAPCFSVDDIGYPFHVDDELEAFCPS